MAEWAYVENNEIVELHDLLPVSWRNISGLRNAADNIEFLNSVGWYKVNKQVTEYDDTQFKVIDYTYNFLNNNVQEVPVLEQKEIIAIDEVEVQRQIKNKFMEALRNERDKLLSKSDISQLSDNLKKMSPDEINQWETYRQSLRDLPAQYENSDVIYLQDVIWPTIDLNV